MVILYILRRSFSLDKAPTKSRGLNPPPFRLIVLGAFSDNWLFSPDGQPVAAACPVDQWENNRKGIRNYQLLIINY